MFVPGYIDQEDVAALYSLATAFAYPSLWEGFGLPVLEDPALRADVSESGHCLAAQFSRGRCARKTLAVYEAVVGYDSGGAGMALRSDPLLDTRTTSHTSAISTGA